MAMAAVGVRAPGHVLGVDDPPDQALCDARRKTSAKGGLEQRGMCCIPALLRQAGEMVLSNPRQTGIVIQ